jgi:chaperone required for assembly of F1-ATPase
MTGKTPHEERIPSSRAIKRFYKQAEMVARDEAFAVALDGKILKTPRGRPLILPSWALAAAIAREWQTQEEFILPSSMPLTRLANVAVDSGNDGAPSLRAGIVAYSASDLTCYLAEHPESLVQRQEATWGSLRQWLAAEMGIALKAGRGVMPIAQDSTSLETLRSCLEDFDVYALTALYTLTSLSGSVVIALAVAKGQIAAGEGFEAARLDERFQAEHWGEDAQAEAAMATREHDFLAASRFLQLLNPA